MTVIKYLYLVNYALSDVLELTFLLSVCHIPDIVLNVTCIISINSCHSEEKTVDLELKDRSAWLQRSI